MPEELTWQTYLDHIHQHLTTEQRQALYTAIGVSRISIGRWRKGTNKPDAIHLQRLIENVPAANRERLVFLIQADPEVSGLLPLDESSPPPVRVQNERIPQEVYERVMRMVRATPKRSWVICQEILVEALEQMETTPQPTSMEITIARCMPPRENDGKIRSLREYVGKGTPPWRADVHPKYYFLGIESLAGYAVMQRHGVMEPDLQSPAIIAPIHRMKYERSASAYPILRDGQVAGVLIVSCAQSAFFTKERLALIERYADLLSIAFYDHELYSSSLIDLALMPDWEVQQRTAFDDFRKRVNDEYKRLMNEGCSLAELSQIEQYVLGRMEGELLHLASTSRGQAENPATKGL